MGKGSGRYSVKEGAALPKTAAELQKLISQGKVSYKVQNSISRFHSTREVGNYLGNKLKADIKAKSGIYGVKQSRHIVSIIQALNTCGIQCATEYVFDAKKKFRFDIVILPLESKIAIEYEGIFSEKSRHTNLRGFPTDCYKYRLATVQGWRVLRYTAVCLKGLNGEFKVVEDVKKILKQGNK